jgi:hypothetical protein
LIDLLDCSDPDLKAKEKAEYEGKSVSAVSLFLGIFTLLARPREREREGEREGESERERERERARERVREG